MSNPNPQSPAPADDHEEPEYHQSAPRFGQPTEVDDDTDQPAPGGRRKVVVIGLLVLVGVIVLLWALLSGRNHVTKDELTGAGYVTSQQVKEQVAQQLKGFATKQDLTKSTQDMASATKVKERIDQLEDNSKAYTDAKVKELKNELTAEIGKVDSRVKKMAEDLRAHPTLTAAEVKKLVHNELTATPGEVAATQTALQKSGLADAKVAEQLRHTREYAKATVQSIDGLGASLGVAPPADGN